MIGLPLEVNGGSGSAGAHWARLFLYDEMMTGSQIHNRPLSIFTLALLEDSGWYEVDRKYVEELQWGRDAGCPFIKNTCNPQDIYKKRSEFCINNNEKNSICTFDYSAASHCAADTFSSHCNYAHPYRNYICADTPSSVQKYNAKTTKEVFGVTGSSCFVSNINLYGTNAKNYARCYVAKCKGNVVEIQVDD